MTERPPLRIGLDQFKPGYELRQVYDEGDALEFVKEVKANSEHIEAYEWLDVDDYEDLLELHKSEIIDFRPGFETHFGIWDGSMCKGGISLFPDSHEGTTDLKFWVDHLATGDGVACAALNGLVDYLYNEGKLAGFNIIADVDTENTKAISTLQRTYFIETFRDDEDVQFIPIFTADEEDINESQAIISSQELLEFARDLSFRAPNVKFFDTKTADGVLVRVRVSVDPETGNYVLKISEFVQETDLKKQKINEKTGEVVELDFNRDDRFRYILETKFEIDSEAEIHKFKITTVVRNRETGTIEKRALETFNTPDRPKPVVDRNNHTLGTKTNENQIEFSGTDEIRASEDQVNLGMTKEHRDYILGILINIKV